MGKYRFSKLAEEDLLGIAGYGDEHFGIAQSNRYRDQLKQRFSVLAEQPYLYPVVDHIHKGYRRSVCGKHSIYYRIDRKGVEIIRVLGRQDTEKNLRGRARGIGANVTLRLGERLHFYTSKARKRDQNRRGRASECNRIVHSVTWYCASCSNLFTTLT